MNHSDFRRADLGEFPRLAAALDTVNRDFAATFPDREPLILMVWSGDEDIDEQTYVAMSDGTSHGNGISEPDADAPDRVALDLVAEAAQETVMERLWQVWPVCPFHKIGTHPRPEGTTADWEYGKSRGTRVVWWCRGHRGGDCHDLASVGELAGALPGKQRRELRRRARKSGRTR
ncbi:hypothetical protein R6V09_26880 [Streptomyces sp. W16]|uniref:hypothetical protein n=1 Tax=Streptomyces sp. W16 TaxID=3076631 RepID=UPI00295AE58F|nr:hypothetical protein [Streptomyces sp. W16]MDV9173714.1 hypothetical protein [Streptomyces sp. W16]